MRRRVLAGTIALAAVVGTVAAAAPAEAASLSTCKLISNGNTDAFRFTTIMPSARYEADSATLDCVMKQGVSTSSVWVLQQNLNHCYGSGLAEDGDYGRATRAAVIAVQRKYGLDPDGVYGPKTRDAITWYTSAGCLRFPNPWPTTYGG